MTAAVPEATRRPKGEAADAELVARVRLQFEESAQANRKAVESLAGPIARAAERMAHCLLSNGKILACGTGASAADAQRFSADLLNRYDRDRPPLAAIALTPNGAAMTAIGQDLDFEQLYSRQVHALGQPADLLFALSPTGHCGAVLRAVEAAHDREMRVVALTGGDGGSIARALEAEDVHICVSHAQACRIQEIHLLALHCLCDGIDCLLMGAD
jgi:D-sedoheptulose 7-phosphate isomerase